MREHIIRWSVAAFLMFQVLWLVTRPLHGNFYWAWAPFHEIAWYDIEVEVGEHRWSGEEAMARYHFKTWFKNEKGWYWQSNAMWWVFRAIEMTEQRLADPGPVRVSVHYLLNGRQDVSRWERTFVHGERGGL